MIPSHDQQRIEALDPTGRPFAPDRLRVALAPKVSALQALGAVRGARPAPAGVVAPAVGLISCLPLPVLPI